MFSKIQCLSLIVVAAVPALMGADGNGCAPAPGLGTAGTTGGGACAEQRADVQGGLGCTTFRAFRWDGYSCASLRGCVGSCRGPDCDELYADKESCLAAHSGCPGYVCEDNGRPAFNAYVEQHRSCTSDADCTSVSASCINAGCPAYVNTSVAESPALHYLMSQVQFCTIGDTSPNAGCLTWCQDPRPPACIDGVCAAKP